MNNVLNGHVYVWAHLSGQLGLIAIVLVLVFLLVLGVVKPLHSLRAPSFIIISLGPSTFRVLNLAALDGMEPKHQVLQCAGVRPEIVGSSIFGLAKLRIRRSRAGKM
jgi:hypothetical protein